MQIKPVSVSKTKTKTGGIQETLGAAAAELHESSRVLAQLAAGSTDASVKAAVAQILEVEQQLHAAVAELAVVRSLLKGDEAKSAETGQGAARPPVRRKQTK
jgi:hypothetical protein